MEFDYDLSPKWPCLMSPPFTKQAFVIERCFSVAFSRDRNKTIENCYNKTWNVSKLKQIAQLSNEGGTWKLINADGIVKTFFGGKLCNSEVQKKRSAFLRRHKKRKC